MAALLRECLGSHSNRPTVETPTRATSEITKEVRQYFREPSDNVAEKN